MNIEPIKGFSKLSKEAKLEWVTKNYAKDPEKAYQLLKSYWHQDPKVQRLHDEFIENTLSNFYIPFGVAPNFLINGKMYTIPMAIEESSVVAAAAKAATFWLDKGGFKARVISTKKIGHVHFVYYGDFDKLSKFFERIKPEFFKDTENLTANMRARGGGISDIILINKSFEEPNYYQIQGTFETCDSMGANFINSCLEQFSQTFKKHLENASEFTEKEKEIQVIMCILSNYVPECLVRAEVSCKIEDLNVGEGFNPFEFADKFEKAVHVARIEPYRATTHNKGIFNGIDAVVIATGNDFRAVEACGHAYASRTGKYRSLTDVSIENGVFNFWIEIPMALGTVGGLTSLHPMVKFAHELLNNPNAEELMMITAVAGLAQNFGALRSLVTTGIQKGHMKMHLFNILNQLEATEEEKDFFKDYFRDKIVTHASVVSKFCELRGIPQGTKVLKH